MTYRQIIRKQNPLTDDGANGMKVGALLAKYGTGKFYELRFEQGSFAFRRNPRVIEEEAKLDGIYILRTSVPEEIMDTRATNLCDHRSSTTCWDSIGCIHIVNAFFMDDFSNPLN